MGGPPVTVHGLQAQEGETVFAFLVLRLREVRERDGVVALLRYIAPLIPNADNFIDEWAADGGEPLRILGMPWRPPDAGHAVDAQRRLIEGTGGLGVEAAWFFQTGTSLPPIDDDEPDDDDDDDEVESMRAQGESRGPRATTRDDREVGDVTDTSVTTPVPRMDMDDLDLDDDAIEDADRAERRTRSVAGEIGGGSAVSMSTLAEADDDDDDDYDAPGEVGSGSRVRPAGAARVGVRSTADDNIDDNDDHVDRGAPTNDAASWSAGPPPALTHVRFPVDGYPAILDEHDWEDFGIAVKLAGSAIPGQAGVLFGFHSMWLAPYGGRYRNTAVTFDLAHNAAHFWVDRFAVPTDAAQQVHHLLWVIAKLDEVLPIIHSRFAEASMSQKYAGLVGETSSPFVLGGNPLLAVHAAGGEEAVDRFIAEQTVWSPEEVAAMLREVAIEIVTADGEEGTDVVDDDDDDDDDDDVDDGDGDPDDVDDDAGGRQITSYAGEVLRARAAAGKLHPRAVERLLPVLDQPGRYEHRRQAVVDIFGALKYRAAVPAMIRILETTTIKNSLDSIGKEDFIAATAAALGAIGDPSAIGVLARVVAAPGTHNDKPRPVAADALASCLQATPEPRELDEAVLDQLLTTISERNDGELNAETHFAYGRLVKQLPPERRAVARRKLADTDTARDDATAMLARQAALLLASPTTPIDPPPRDLQPLLRESLTTLDYDHEYTVRNLRIALRVAELVPDLVDPDDLVWLTRFAEPDVRRAAHALLAKLGKPLADAPAFDRVWAQALGDHEVVRLIGEPHIVGRAAVIAEAGRRHLDAALRAMINACHDVIGRARQGGENLLDPDTRVLEAAVPVLRELPLHSDTVVLFERMLRHTNAHVKWELLEDAPRDERLIGGMFHVLAERWGWQEKAAREWLAHYQHTPAYEAERAKVGSPPLGEANGTSGADDEVDGDSDDEDMN